MVGVRVVARIGLLGRRLWFGQVGADRFATSRVRAPQRGGPHEYAGFGLTERPAALFVGVVTFALCRLPDYADVGVKLLVVAVPVAVWSA
jgi:hypothetical protein